MDYKKRINDLISLADQTLRTTQTTSSTISSSWVDNELFRELRASSLSFILSLYGETHPYYTDFNRLVVRATPYDTEDARGILKSIKKEIDGGWLSTVKGILSAEIFSDFLEMAEHLLKEGYKDAAAVMIGSVLEGHLKQLCVKNKIAIEDNKSGKMLPKKADTLNSELAAASVYNKLDQKQVTTSLDVRNKAAHGKYQEYNHQQVELMLQAVTEFISRNKV